MLSQSEAPDYSIKEMLAIGDDTCTMLNRIQNAAVSDTTEDDSSNLLTT